MSVTVFWLVGSCFVPGLGKALLEKKISPDSLTSLRTDSWLKRDSSVLPRRERWGWESDILLIFQLATKRHRKEKLKKRKKCEWLVHFDTKQWSMLIANFLCSRGKPWCVRCCCAAWRSRPPGFEILWWLIKVFWFPQMEYKHWRLYLNKLLESLLLEYLLLHQCLKIEVDHENMLQYNTL